MFVARDMGPSYELCPEGVVCYVRLSRSLEKMLKVGNSIRARLSLSQSSGARLFATGQCKGDQQIFCARLLCEGHSVLAI